mmetsp:Transcript_29985/g.35635  ORF Transcript_29985/g.35635 Transcript_29985/m.35635 type:complete len:169 (-) Transcript_29985:150-656(-)|eukprot:CAMPEP_0198270352 /NCGR_PEP_ID=MMETSP1447-20131203/44782_1 /TAXON_ID=420782 /ORGANISM="Chaetoceros dichaeta, Strain CCMP1751" /LENGTH=168 /DNA_ID=CAMNT_0043962347 /DNA_START=80 /DNA_END=586 /DNA_ORIENTATION=+
MKAPSAVIASFATMLFMSSPALAGNCEVCIKVMDDVRGSMEKKDQKNKPQIEQALGKYCAKSPAELGPRERKICYYIDPMKRDIAQPFSLGMPSQKVCDRINKNNPEICAVKFPVATEKMEKQDLSKLRVKQLKSILADRNVECRGCVEKEEFVKKVQDTEHLANVEL